MDNPNEALELYRKFIREEISFEEFTTENNRILREALKEEQEQPETQEQQAQRIFNPVHWTEKQEDTCI